MNFLIKDSNLIYFLWAFLFGILGISILRQSFQSSYKYILRFSGGVILILIGFLCLSKIEIPVKYNYGSIIVAHVQKMYASIFGKIQSSIS